MFYVPELTGAPYQWVILAFAVSAPLFFLNEAQGWLSLGYSKFAIRTQRFSVPSKIGMLAIYVPPAVTYPAVFFALDGPTTPWHLLCLGLWVVHFGKRCLETLFVHRYSGVMNGWTVVTICALYSAVGALLAYPAATEITAELVASDAFRPAVALGVVVWTAGTALNGYHHVLLARLRRPGDTGYVLPRGGLFRWVACPHYLGEIVAWLGYALVYHHVGAWVAVLTMTAYLCGRAHNTLRWYGERVGEVPAGWRRVVPGIY